jgi:hypothetical protein
MSMAAAVLSTRAVLTRSIVAIGDGAPEQARRAPFAEWCGKLTGS